MQGQQNQETLLGALQGYVRITQLSCLYFVLATDPSPAN